MYETGNVMKRGNSEYTASNLNEDLLVDSHSVIDR